VSELLGTGMDVCMNKAGLAHPQSLQNGKTDGWRTMIDVGVTVHVYIWKPIPATQYIFQMLILSKNVEIKTEKKSRLWDYKALSAQCILLRY
jgi:NAD(P)-dependent dehydrogenase (short-subunit alcohol dehydrogenase family)